MPGQQPVRSVDWATVGSQEYIAVGTFRENKGSKSKKRKARPKSKGKGKTGVRGNMAGGGSGKAAGSGSGSGARDSGGSGDIGTAPVGGVFLLSVGMEEDDSYVLREAAMVMPLASAWISDVKFSPASFNGPRFLGVGSHDSKVTVSLSLSHSHSYSHSHSHSPHRASLPFRT